MSGGDLVPMQISLNGCEIFVGYIFKDYLNAKNTPSRENAADDEILTHKGRDLARLKASLDGKQIIIGFLCVDSKAMQNVTDGNPVGDELTPLISQDSKETVVGYTRKGVGIAVLSGSLENTSYEIDITTTATSIQSAKSAESLQYRGDMSAYTVFQQVYRQELKEQQIQMNSPHFSVKCAEKWKGMSEKQKKKYSDLAAEDKVRQAEEQAAMSTPTRRRSGSNKKRTKREIDPRYPRGAVSAFFIYAKDERLNATKANPTMRPGDISKLLSIKWKSLSSDAKAPYNQLASEDRDRFKREMEEYREILGPFGVAPGDRTLCFAGDLDDDDLLQEDSDGG